MPILLLFQQLCSHKINIFVMTEEDGVRFPGILSVASCCLFLVANKEREREKSVRRETLGEQTRENWGRQQRFTHLHCPKLILRNLRQTQTFCIFY